MATGFRLHRPTGRLHAKLKSLRAGKLFCSHYVFSHAIKSRKNIESLSDAILRAIGLAADDVVMTEFLEQSERRFRLNYMARFRSCHTRA